MDILLLLVGLGLILGGANFLTDGSAAVCLLYTSDAADDQ